MKNSELRLFIPALLLILLLASCQQDKTAAEPPPDPVIVTPSGGGSSSASDIIDAISDTAVEEEEVQPKIDLPSGSVILQIVNENLDIDQAEEQIIAYRPKDAPGTPIHLIVADYDAIQDTYFPAWDSTLDIVNTMSFSLSFMDLVGDHIPEIICSGTDAETGNQLMRVYKKSLNANGFGLYFAQICSLSVRGSIQITQVDRDQAYYNGQKNGKSFPIVTHERDTSSENLSDLIKTTYYWRYQDSAYVEVLKEKVYGEKIEDERLNRLFRSGETEFESFIQGTWLKSDHDASGRVTHSILYFNRDKNNFSIYSGDIQEDYLWQTSNRTNYNQLYLIGVNDLIRFIRKQLSITVRDLNNIYVWTNDTNDAWAGEYQRISGDIKSIFYPQSQSDRELPFKLSGVFTNEAGESIVFDEPRFQYRDKDGERRGGYALYISGAGDKQNLVLELQFLSDAGLVQERRIYKADYLEEKREQEIIRTLVLIPGKVGIRGFLPDGSGFIQYEQIETLDLTGGNEETENGAAASTE